MFARTKLSVKPLTGAAPPNLADNQNANERPWEQLRRPRQSYAPPFSTILVLNGNPAASQHPAHCTRNRLQRQIQTHESLGTHKALVQAREPTVHTSIVNSYRPARHNETVAFNQRKGHDMFDINGKTAVITGGTSGIGLATAKAFLKKGAKVVIAGRNAQRGADAEAQLKRVAPDVVFRQTDTSDEDDVKALIDINLTGVFYGIKYAALQMEKQGNGGAIVSTSSIEGCVGDPMLPHYNAAKGGVNLLTKSSALALAKYGIRVNTVNPGYIETGMVNEGTMGKEGIEHLKGLHPLGRLGQASEIAHGVVFLVENEFTTGHNLYIDGGYTAQ